MEKKGGHEVKRFWFCLLALALLMSGIAARAEMGEEEDGAWYAEYVRVDGDTLTVLDGVVALGSCWGEWIEVDGEEEYVEPSAEAQALFADSFSLDYWMDIFETEDGEALEIRRIRLPASLRALGSEAICSFAFDAFTLPETLERIDTDALLYCSVDTLRIECALPWHDVWLGVNECRILNYEVPDGHPLYKTVDGVLFSADGKTLLSFPGGRTDTHYDVPAGVETIGERAFANASLQTVSLPIGLREVGDYAFAGCTRLQAAALPLTVAAVGEDVFYECVSLELVSLPEGLAANRNEDSDWIVYYPDSALYRGDNGDTVKAEAREPGDNVYQDSDYLWEPGRVNGDGQPVPVYADETGDQAALYLPDGAFVYLKWCEGNRVLLGTPLDPNGEYGWADLKNVTFAPGETLFHYADLLPPAEGQAWTRYLPAPGLDAETAGIPLNDPQTLVCHLYGPVVVFRGYYGGYDEANQVSFGCRVQDVPLLRVSDGTDTVYAIVYSGDLFENVPLMDQPDGAEREALPAGTQVMVLDEAETGYRVTTGFSEGWISKNNVKIVPIDEEGDHP